MGKQKAKSRFLYENFGKTVSRCKWENYPHPDETILEARSAKQAEDIAYKLTDAYELGFKDGQKVKK